MKLKIADAIPTKQHMLFEITNIKGGDEKLSCTSIVFGILKNR